MRGLETDPRGSRNPSGPIESSAMFEFKVTNRDKKSAARTGIFYTPHGSFRTPVFMPVGTYGAVKTVSPDELRAIGSEIILGNTFHLHLRPGEAVVKKMGGLQTYNRWEGPMLTDSGGFQVFSLAKMRKMYDDRVEFRSPLDGSKHVFTPQKVLQIQRDLGTDIAMQLDECVPGDASRKVAEVALDRTHRWAEESVKYWQKMSKSTPRVGSTRGVEGSGQMALFPIVQGASYKDLRQDSARFMASLPTPGVAIGGLAVGETKAQFHAALDAVCPLLPQDKPRYLMGVGDPIDIIQAVMRGVDMFDCVMPTRLARHGAYWTPVGRANIKLAKNKLVKQVMDKNCRCPACAGGYTRGYLRHLFVLNESLGQRMLTLHNLTFLFDLLAEIRTAIQKNEMGLLLRKYSKKRF